MQICRDAHDFELVSAQVAHRLRYLHRSLHLVDRAGCAAGKALYKLSPSGHCSPIRLQLYHRLGPASV